MFLPGLSIPFSIEYLDIPGLLILKGLKLFLAHKYLEQQQQQKGALIKATTKQKQQQQ